MKSLKKRRKNLNLKKCNCHNCKVARGEIDGCIILNDSWLDNFNNIKTKVKKRRGYLRTLRRRIRNKEKLVSSMENLKESDFKESDFIYIPPKGEPIKNPVYTIEMRNDK